MNNYEEVKQSFARCMIKGDVIGRFYDIFLDSYPAIKPRFANTDFDSQKHLLRQGVNLAIMFASNNPVGKKGIERIRKSHSKSGLNIPPDLEESDLDILVDTLPGTTLLDLGAIQIELEEILGAPVDVLTPKDLPPKFREQVLREAVSI